MIEKQELTQMLFSGMPVTQIARHFGVSRIRIYQLLRKHNLTPPKPDKPKKLKPVTVTLKITRLTKAGAEQIKTLKFKSRTMAFEISAEEDD